MPQYEFKDSKNKIKEFYFSSESAPSIGSEVEIEGIKYVRLPSFLNAQVDSIKNIDITSAKQFSEITGKKSGTYGDLLDLSSELSQAREEKYGRDKIGEKFDKDRKEKMDARKARNRVRKLKESSKVRKHD